MQDRIPPLEARVDRLETSISNGFEKLERLVRDQLSDLKGGQLADIKSSIERVERDLKEDLTRVADDQRRLWERVESLQRQATEGARLAGEHAQIMQRIEALERRDAQRAGSSRTLQVFFDVLKVCMGGAIAWVLAKWK